MAAARIVRTVFSKVIVLLLGFMHVLLPFVVTALTNNDILVFIGMILQLIFMGFVFYAAYNDKSLWFGIFCGMGALTFWKLSGVPADFPKTGPFFIFWGPAHLFMISVVANTEKHKPRNAAPLAVSEEGESMPAVRFVPLTEPTPEIAAAFERWENDPQLIPLSRPNRDRQDLEKRHTVTAADLAGRMANNRIFLIYEGERLLGEMDFQVDPRHLLKKEPGTAWIGITIGEADGRGRGLGRQALQHLEAQIAAQGLARIELGVFEFNLAAQSLYEKLGYQEIGRIDDFTYWDGLMWQDIRMEKYLATDAR